MTAPIRRSWSVWAVALGAMLPMALVFWAWVLPSDESSFVLLAGEWRGAGDGDSGDPSARLKEDLSTWKPVKLPGRFGAQGLEGPDVVLRREVLLPPRLREADLLLVLGHVRYASVRASFNGTRVGVRGLYGPRFIGSESQLTAFFIPRTLLREGANEVAFEVHSVSGTRDGLTDSRILLGRQDTLVTWVFHEASVRGLFELGGQLLAVFLAVVVIVLWRLQGDRAGLTVPTLGFLLASVLYLNGKSGLLVSSVLPLQSIVGEVVVAVQLLGLVTLEFMESYYLGRVTLLRKLNRLVSGGFLVVALVSAALSTRQLSVYGLYVNWLFVLLGYCVYLGVRDLVRPSTRFGPIVTVAVFLTVGAGINDLLNDLDLVFTPRLFTLAVANLGTASAIVVIGEFLQLAESNRALSATLAERNEALGVALQKAQESARIKSEFLANTSHELRTPLNAIINIPQGLLEQIDAGGRARCQRCGALFELEAGERFDPGAPCPECQQPALRQEPAWKRPPDAAEASRLLGSVVSSGTHLLAVVNDILDYSKLEAGRMTLHREAVDVAELFDSVRATLGPVAHRAGVALEVETVPRGSSLAVDRVKVMQVLINLVSNALKFSDGRGAVHVSSEVTPTSVRFLVRDEGIGIAPQHHEAIFEGFRQVESGTTRRFGGTGLGLAISRRITEAHGGTLTVKSTLGQGSMFIVELPRSAPEPQPVASGRTVLLVDDEVSALDAAASALKPLGLGLVTVRDPRDAIAKAKELTPELILLDVMMPRVSGLEVLEALKRDPALAPIPVIVSSAWPDNQRACEVLGATFLPKPWEPGALLRLVEATLARPRTHAPGATP